MKVCFPKENFPGENRCALHPAAVKKWKQLGAEILMETGLGQGMGFKDEVYAAAGADVLTDRRELLNQADLVLRLRKPELSEVPLLRKKSIHLSFLEPFTSAPLLAELAKQGVTAFAIELIPRITRAQKMDALSSQASLAGYVAVILAAERLNQIFPMMMTPAGTISPSRVFVIGAGVAGLQAIATARRLGARVDAFDTRPAVEEQVRSLGAKFLKIDLGQTGETQSGYAKALTREQEEKQREVMAKTCAAADVVITTAQVFGRKAPILITRDMLAKMKPGALVVDMAIETGGNVEGAVLEQEIEIEGVRVMGYANLANRVCVHATQMYASNVLAFVEEFWDKKEKTFSLKLEDEIMRAALVTHAGEVRFSAP